MGRASIDEAIESLDLDPTPKHTAIPHSPLDWNDEDLMNLLEDEELHEVYTPSAHVITLHEQRIPYCRVTLPSAHQSPPHHLGITHSRWCIIE